MRNLTFEINREECVGDSVGKHNYNSISLDTAICNLSSLVFTGTDNLLTWFNDISNNIVDLGNSVKNFSGDAVVRYNLAHTTIDTLSSYWNISEFTVQFEHDLYTADENLNIPISSIPLPINAYTSSILLDDLINVAKNYLNDNFSSNFFNNGTRANVVVFLYNTLNVKNLSQKTYAVLNNKETEVSNPNLALQLLDDYNQSNLGYYISNNTLQVNNSYGRRSIKVDFFKESVKINNISIVKFIKDNNIWKTTEVILNDQTKIKI